MQKIGRIDEICEMINILWHRNPNKRLGQILYDYGFKCNDLLNVTDENLKQNIHIKLCDDK